jgi:hypothetical protein
LTASGRNDTHSGDPEVPDKDGFFWTQNSGQIPHDVREGMPAEMHPGEACQPGGFSD